MCNSQKMEDEALPMAEYAIINYPPTKFAPTRFDELITFKDAMRQEDWERVERMLVEHVPRDPVLRNYDHYAYCRHDANRRVMGMPPFPVLEKLVKASSNIPVADNLYETLRFFYLHEGWCEFAPLVKLYRQTGMSFNSPVVFPLMINHKAPDEHFQLMSDMGVRLFPGWRNLFQRGSPERDRVADLLRRRIIIVLHTSTRCTIV